jgi:hypothetical protein
MGRICVYPDHIVSTTNYMIALPGCSPTLSQPSRSQKTVRKHYHGQEDEQVSKPEQPLQYYIVDDSPEHKGSSQDGEYDFWDNNRTLPAFHGHRPYFRTADRVQRGIMGLKILSHANETDNMADRPI